MPLACGSWLPVHLGGCSTTTDFPLVSTQGRGRTRGRLPAKALTSLRPKNTPARCRGQLIRLARAVPNPRPQARPKKNITPTRCGGQYLSGLGLYLFSSRRDSTAAAPDVYLSSRLANQRAKKIPPQPKRSRGQVFRFALGGAGERELYTGI